MNSKKLIIEPGCIACGVCLAASPLFAETKEGLAEVKGAGIVPGNETAAVQEIIDGCPAHVIKLRDVSVKTKDQLLQLIQGKLENYVLPIPSRSNFDFDKDSISVPIPFSPGEYQYAYSSYGKAQRAGLDEFNRLMFSQRKSIIQNIFIAYKANKILPYYRYEKNDNNFYYKVERKIQALLEEIAAEVKLTNPGAKLPADFSTFTLSFDPKKFDMVDYFKTIFEQQMANRVLDYLSSDCYSLSSYECYFDIDDSEEYAGTGMFGKEKFVTKYCFYNLKEAFTSLSNDIVGACRSEASDAVEEAYGFLCSLWKEAEKAIRQQLSKKADAVKQILN